MSSAPMAEWMARLHPLRLQYELFSEANPLMGQVKNAAEQVREERRPVNADNPFLALQQTISDQIVAGLDAWRVATETFSERAFLSVYGSPALQASVGIDPADDRPQRRAAKNPLHRELLDKRIAELKSHIGQGGLRECVTRSMLYIGMARGGADERGAAAIRRLRRHQDDK